MHKFPLPVALIHIWGGVSLFSQSPPPLPHQLHLPPHADPPFE